MTRRWRYPIYLIQHGGGYASIVDPLGENDANQSLVVCCEEERAIGFMAACGIMGAPRELNNDREFGWLLQSLQAPVTDVVFDPSPSVDDQDTAWRVSVRDLLDQHLNADNSPWNYPVYVVAKEEGFISVSGPGNDGQTVNAIGFFTSEERIEAYLTAADETGTPCAITNLEEARSFLKAIAPHSPAVALNPVISEGQCVAKHCFAIETLLEKYLVVTDKDAEEER